MNYSNDKNTQLLLSLLKSYGIRKVIASPGTTNIAIVGSMQHDAFFEMYSVVDERSAAYMACGLAAESGEVVALVCTGATASRNYLPGITEAHYRKLPVLVIAGSHGEEKIGHLHSQVVDRTQSPKDTVLFSAFLNPIRNKTDEWYNTLNINKALTALKRRGGGPVLINIVSSAGSGFDTKELPRAKRINHYQSLQNLPAMPSGRTAVFVGSHTTMPDSLVNAIDQFCASHDAVVFCDHTSGYNGKYKVQFALVCSQQHYDTSLVRPDLLVHIGEVSGDTYTTRKLKPGKVWRVSPDGEFRDLFKSLDSVFEMDEDHFFAHYTAEKSLPSTYREECNEVYQATLSQLPDLQFGNLYVAKTLSRCLPEGCVIHFGIFNSLRSWNFFELDSSIQSSCNVGGFGIDGAVSTLLGSALANPDKIHYLCVGDLAFFYDLNSIGNRHVGNNVRILLVNNGRGVEFRKKDHPGYQFGESADLFIAAGGHFGRQSHYLVKHIAEDLGFEYLTATNKEDFDSATVKFVNKEMNSRPIIFEVFPEVADEIGNLDAVRNIVKPKLPVVDKMLESAKTGIKGIVKAFK